MFAFGLLEGWYTVALLGEEEICLLCGGQVGDTVASVEHGWPLAGRECGVGPDCAALVVTEAAGERILVSFCSPMVALRALGAAQG